MQSEALAYILVIESKNEHLVWQNCPSIGLEQGVYIIAGNLLASYKTLETHRNRHSRRCHT